MPTQNPNLNFFGKILFPKDAFVGKIQHPHNLYVPIIAERKDKMGHIKITWLSIAVPTIKVQE